MPLDRNKQAQKDDEYQYWMSLADQDWETAARQFIKHLGSKEKAHKYRGFINSLQEILAGNEDAWQKGSGVRSAEDAVKFVISNVLLSGMGMTVIRSPKPYYEGIAEVVASLISEEIDFQPMTVQEKRIKMIAESHGFTVCRLTE